MKDKALERVVQEYELAINTAPTTAILLRSPPIRLNYHTLSLITSHSSSTSIYSVATTSLDSLGSIAEVYGGERGLVAIKRVEGSINHVPSDVKREAYLLAKLCHPNTLHLFNAYSVPIESSTSSTHLLITPLYPLSLTSLLTSCSFLPPPSLSSLPPSSTTTAFSVVTHSLAWQMIEAVRYIHANGVAHRDIGASNFVLSRGGRIILIDFELAVERGDEQPGRMYFEVGTAHYRAPELLFGSRSYDPPGLDLWALAVTLAELFTPLNAAHCPSSSSRGISLASLVSASRAGTHEKEDDDMIDISDSFSGMDMEKKVRLRRQSLFKSNFGEFALIGSIFRVVGTPTVETWPEAVDLPDFFRFAFLPFPPTPISSHLPYLPTLSPLEYIISSFLTCSAAQRLTAQEAANREEWQDVVVLSPSDFDCVGHDTATEWQGQTLGDLMWSLLEHEA